MELLLGQRDVNSDILDKKRTNVALVRRYGWGGEGREVTTRGGDVPLVD